MNTPVSFWILLVSIPFFLVGFVVIMAGLSSHIKRNQIIYFISNNPVMAILIIPLILVLNIKREK